ncbi:unannotated protein [freshwater metagenome]|uniref:Unannotated protein n=1 Tax=freshwater metagenome TaxID=449393 RepID=A0A6J7FXK6_9ZZZZ
MRSARKRLRLTRPEVFFLRLISLLELVFSRMGGSLSLGVERTFFLFFSRIITGATSNSKLSWRFAGSSSRSIFWISRSISAASRYL